MTDRQPRPDPANRRPGRLSRRGLLKLGAAALPLAAPLHESAAAPALFWLGRSRPAAAVAPRPRRVQRGGTLIIGTAQQVQTLDPHKGGLRNNRNAWPGLYSFLTQYDERGLPAPFLAGSWQVAPDELSWTFTLRQGVRFHNGRALTADDVKFSLERVLARETASPLAAALRPVQGVEAVDASTARINLSRPHGALAAALAPVAIVARENADDLATRPIGSGPMKLKEYVAGQYLELEKNPDYWEQGSDGSPLPYLDGVRINTLTDTNALFTALSTGTVQAFWQMSEQFQIQAERNPQLQLVPARFKTTYDEYFFQADAPPFDDRNARLALLLALDKDAINQAGYFGRAEPRWNNNIMPPGSWAEKDGIEPIKRDPQRARQLFEAAGVSQIKFLGYNETPQFRPISQVMERNLNEIGIKLNLEFTDLTTWLARIQSGNPNAAWGNGTDGDAFTVNIAVRPPDPSIALSYWGCRTHTGSHFCSDALAQAALEGAQALGGEQRKEAYARYQEIWQQEIPAIVTCFRAFTHGAVSQVHDLYDDDGALNYRLAWTEK